MKYSLLVPAALLVGAGAVAGCSGGYSGPTGPDSTQSRATVSVLERHGSIIEAYLQQSLRFDAAQPPTKAERRHRAQILL